MEKQMDFRDGRGEHCAMIGEKNKEKVKKFMIDNPSATMAECMRSTGLSFKTVKKHAKAIFDEQHI